MSYPRWVALAIFVSSCGAPPAPAAHEPASQASSAAKRSSTAADDCAIEPGKPPPEPLLKDYTGVARKARCQREVYTIMGGVTHFLGVECKHCHLEPDYPAMTHRKQVANWMAKELIPRLQKRDGAGEVWCNDCHQGKARILGNPRKPEFAIDWMSTHLVEDFDTSLGKALKCRNCHKGDLGSPEFQRKIILTGNLPEGRAQAPKERSSPLEAAPAPVLEPPN